MTKYGIYQKGWLGEDLQNKYEGQNVFDLAGGVSFTIWQNADSEGYMSAVSLSFTSKSMRLTNAAGEFSGFAYDANRQVWKGFETIGRDFNKLPFSSDKPLKAMADNLVVDENEQKRKLEELWQKMTKAFAGYGSSSPTKDEIELLEWAKKRDEMHVRVAPVMTAEPMYLGQQLGLGNGGNQTQITNNLDGFSQALDRNARVLRVIDTHITNANGKVEVIRADMSSDNNEFDVRYIDTDRNIRYVRFRDEEHVGEVIVDVAERHHRNLATPTRDIRSGGGLETRLLNFSEYLNGRTVIVMEGERTREDIINLRNAQRASNSTIRAAMGSPHLTSYAADIMVLDGNGEFMNRMDVAQEAYYSGEFNRVIYYGNNAQTGFIHVDLYPNGWQGVRQYNNWNTIPSWVR